MNNTEFLGWVGCCASFYSLSAGQMVFIDQRVSVLDLICLQSQSPKPAPGFLRAGQGTGERQGWLARGELGFSMSDISFNEALSGTRLARSGVHQKPGQW